MNLTLKQYIEKITSWESPKAIFQAYLEKAKSDPYNAYVRIWDQKRIDSSEEINLDSYIKQVIENEWINFSNLEEYLLDTPLKWAPIAVKDNFLTKWFISSAGSKMLENYVCPYSSTVYENLVKAWWLMLWKANMDEFAMGSSTETSYFWSTKNPVDTSKVPWGSSGGSAAAVAGDLAVAALGTDTGGSIRQPASLCGVVGFKPTYGTNSRYGIVAMASSLDQAWTFTKTVEDCVILSKVLASYDENDATSIKRDDLNKWDEALQKQDLKWLKVALPKEFLGEWLQEWVKNKILEAVEKIKSLWAQVEEVSMPLLKHALEAYYIIMPAEVSTNLARFDGIRYGYAKNTFDFKNIYEYYAKVRAEGFGKEAKRRILLWTYVLSAGAYEKFYWQAQKVRRLIKQEYDKIFKDYDLIIWPTSPTTAWDLGAKTEDPLAMYLADIYTVPVNLAGLPAMSLPVGNATDTNLPVGLHIIADQFKEDKIFHLANILEKEMGRL